MSVTQQDIDALNQELETLVGETESFFGRVWNAISKAAETDPSVKYAVTVSASLISDEDLETVVPSIADRLAKLVFRTIETSKSSPLVSEVDRSDLRVFLKEMLASLQFHSYRHWETHILNDEDRILGVEPAGQSEDTCTFSDAKGEFRKAAAKLSHIIGLIFPSDTPVAVAIARSETANIKSYRPNTAFILMWISKDHPELEDVKNCFQEVFKKFGITAIRADEIEHSEQITERILAEIKTSEYLIADLTGERTSVYYEIGYAHALGKHPILFRKARTKIGFDLAGHNCPEYENMTDLRQKLENRLIAMTNRTAAPETAVPAQAVGKTK